MSNLVRRKFKSQKYKERLLAHYRNLIYYEEWFWYAKHKDYTDKEILKWVARINERRKP